MTTEQHIGCVFSTPEDEASLSGLHCFSPLPQSTSSSPKSQSMASDEENKNENEGCPSPGCFSLSDFDWDDPDPAATASAVQHKFKSNTKYYDSDNDRPYNNDRSFLPSPSTSVANSSFCPQGAESSWPSPSSSFQSAHLPPSQAQGHNFASPDSSGMMASSSQPFHFHGSNMDMDMATHLNNNSTDTETLQLYVALQKAQQDYLAMLLQFSSGAANNTATTTPSPSSLNTNFQAVNLYSLNVSVAPNPMNNLAGTGSPSTFVFSSPSGNQQRQHDQVQSQMMMQGCPQQQHHSPHFNGYDQSQQLPYGLFASGGIGIGNNTLVDPAIILNHPTRLSIPSDEEFLDPIYNFLRSSFIEVFVCRDNNSGRGRGASSHAIGQVGLRCVHCKNIERNKRANQAESYPSKTTNIFESVRNYHRKHLHACKHIPSELKKQFRDMMSNPYRKVHTKYVKIYFAEAACEIGMVETPKGLFFGTPPNTSGKPSQKLQAIMKIAGNPTSLKHKHLSEVLFPKVDERLENCKFYHIASANTRQVIDNCRKEKAVFVYPSDFPTVADLRFVLYHQFVSCRPSSAALSRRKTKPDKWETLSGLYCKHCANAHQGQHYPEGMYFPLDFESLHDSSFSHHLMCHIITCPYALIETKEALDELQALAAEHGVITKRGAKKKFLQKVWDRLSNHYAAP